MESANCLAAAGSLQSGVELPTLGTECHQIIFADRGSLTQDSISHLAHNFKLANKETSAGCLEAAKLCNVIEETRLSIQLYEDGV